MDWYLTDSKSRIAREIHPVKKTREFHDNESENISGESIGAAALIRGRRLLTFFVPDAALIWGRRLIKGGAYSSKYGVNVTDQEHAIPVYCVLWRLVYRLSWPILQGCHDDDDDDDDEEQNGRSGLED